MRIRAIVGTAVAMVVGALTSAAIEVGPVLSNSMAPTLRARGAAKDVVVVEKVSRLIRNPSRWDIVTFSDPRGGSKVLIKRVVGLPGERVRLVDGQVEIDGRIQPMPEAMLAVKYQSAGVTEWVVPEGRVVVLGDNSPCSVDSRTWGSVEIGSIRGRMLARIAR